MTCKFISSVVNSEYYASIRFNFYKDYCHVHTYFGISVAGISQASSKEIVKEFFYNLFGFITRQEKSKISLLLYNFTNNFTYVFTSSVSDLFVSNSKSIKSVN